MPQSFRYPNLIRLNNINLTDESREPLSESRDERSTDVELASGKIKKFIKTIAKTWDISWANVGLSASDTVDGFGGRNEIRSIAQSGGTMPFYINDGRNSAETYTVFVEGYSEEVLQRRGPGDGFRYQVTISLREQA